MCGRYALYTEVYNWGDFNLAWVFDDEFSWSYSYNIAPNTFAPIVYNPDRPTVALHRWGLVPHWSKDSSIGNRMINARIETVAEKPAFREAFKRRRCLVPANGFFEWQKQGQKKTPYFIKPSVLNLLYFAGLWERWRKPNGNWLKTFTILTTQSNKAMEPIHHRMPVILEPDRYSQWLNRDLMDSKQLKILLETSTEQLLEVYPVSTFVNIPTNNTEECVKPINITS